MPTYRIHVTNVVSTSLDVEAADLPTLLDTYYDDPGMPGPLCHGAFGGVSVNEAGEWEIREVTDVETGRVLWTDLPPRQDKSSTTDES